MSATVFSLPVDHDSELPPGNRRVTRPSPRGRGIPARRPFSPVHDVRLKWDRFHGNKLIALEGPYYAPVTGLQRTAELVQLTTH